MCRLFIGADAWLWRTRLKSVRMRGYSTSVRLENFYWRVLDDIARRDGMAVPQLLAKLHEELIEAHGEIDNFSSFLRVCCGRYLTLQLAGDVPRDHTRPIRELDAEGILRREAARMAEGDRVARRARTPAEPARAAAP
jgi:predicted DNA-binding ribbon-helix-helix protein